ncbi:hypothetical protein Tco_0349373 [Tanacetum coccineum]
MEELQFNRKIKGCIMSLWDFTYVIDFMTVEDISSIIDLRLSQAVLGEPIVEISNMTHDPPEGVVRFIKGKRDIHIKSILRTEEDKRKGEWRKITVVILVRDICPRGKGTDKGDGSSKNYKVLSEMLEDFDRQDVMDLYRLVKERYSALRPEGYDLML